MNEKWRNVSIKECIGTILFAIFSCAVALIPFAFGNGELIFSYARMPLVGDGEIIKFGGVAIRNILDLIPQIPVYISENTEIIYYYTVLAYFAMLAADIVFALLLILFKSKILRIIFKFISVIFAFAYFIIAIINLAYIVGSFLSIINDTENIIENIITLITTYGITTALGFAIFGFALFKKQFKWFSKPAWSNKDKYAI